MQWLNDLPFGDSRVVQIGVLAACGIAALVALAIVYRVVFAHRLRVPGGRTRQPRLGLVDAFSLDGQRQLVLIRRDNIEHLVMIGGPNDVLVEAQINRALAPAREIALTPGSPAAPTRKRAESAAAQPQRTAPVQPAAPIPAPAAASVVSLAAPAVTPTPARAIAPAQVPPVRAQTAPSPSAPPASPVAASPPAPPASDAQPSPPPAPVKAAEAPGPAPAAQPQTRSLPPRHSMPPPISPPGPPAGRTPAARPADAHRLADAPVHSHPTAAQPAQHTLDVIATAVGVEAPSTSAPAQTEPRVGQPAQTKPHFVPSRLEALATKSDSQAAKSETRAGRTEPTAAPPTSPKAPVFPPPIPAAANAAAEIRPEPKADLAAQTPALDASKPALVVETPPAAKSAHSDDDDPFAGLGSLEAEMARLLGRRT
jgi:flagellar protein FliO/FliZ